MNLTVKNFKKHSDQFLKDLEKCDYVAFDLEMSGIRCDEYRSGFDLPFEYYIKASTAPKKFGVIQIGFSLFTETLEGIESRTYNFYTFPRPYKGKFCRDISLDPDCVEFHKKVGTDFQKWIIEGIAYYDDYSTKKLRKAFFPEYEEKANDIKTPLTREDDIIKFKDFSTKLEEWSTNDMKTFEYSEKSGFMRFHFYTHLRANYPDFVHETINNYPEKIIKVIKMTKQERIEYNAELIQKREVEFDDVIGFTKIWEGVKKAGKPMIGHNCYLDYLFTYEHFDHRLTKDYEVFKTKIFKNFKKVYDTKLLADHSSITDKRISSSLCLGDLYKEMKQLTKVKVIIPEGFEDYNKDGNFHEAGYDAFVTGCAYAFMKDRYGDDLVKDNENRVRLHGNQMFQADFSSPKTDHIVMESGFLAISLLNVVKDKTEANKMVDKFRDAFGKLEVKTYLNGSASAIYGHKKFYTMIFTYSKSLMNETINIKRHLKERMEELELTLDILDLKKYAIRMAKIFSDRRGIV